MAPASGRGVRHDVLSGDCRRSRSGLTRQPLQHLAWSGGALSCRGHVSCAGYQWAANRFCWWPGHLRSSPVDPAETLTIYHRCRFHVGLHNRSGSRSFGHEIGVDVHADGIRAGRLATCEYTECARRRRAGVVGLAAGESPGSVVSIDVSFRALDRVYCRSRHAANAADWFMAAYP